MKNEFYRLLVINGKTNKVIKTDVLYTLDRAISDAAMIIARERIEKKDSPIFIDILCIKYDTIIGCHFPVIVNGTHKYWKMYTSNNQSKDFDIQYNELKTNF